MMGLMTPEKTIQHLEALGLGIWKTSVNGNLYRNYEPPTKSRRRPGYPRFEYLNVIIKPPETDEARWWWSVSREGGGAEFWQVRWGLGPSLDQAALEADEFAREYLDQAFELVVIDRAPKSHSPGIFGPGLTRCGQPIREDWDDSRVVGSPADATCRRCSRLAGVAYYQPGYQTTIDGVEILRCPVGEGWKVRCTECDVCFGIPDPVGGYVERYETVIEAHMLGVH